MDRFTIKQSVGKSQYFVFDKNKIIDVQYSWDKAEEIAKYHTSLLPKKNVSV